MFSNFAKSVHYALRGISRVFAEEVNFRIQLAVAAVVLVLAWAMRLSGGEKAVLALAIALVLVLELLNSGLERVVDILKPRIHHYVEEVKDIAAGAVLVASLAALVVGAYIFWPHVFAFITGS